MEFFKAFASTGAASDAPENAEATAPAKVKASAPVTVETAAPSAASSVAEAAGPLPEAPATSRSAVAAPAFSADELRTLQDDVPFAEYGALHERALAYMRWRRDEAVAAEPSIAPSAEAGSDARLMRFLIAKQFDCSGAADMYLGALRWRRDAGIDAHRAAILSANAPFFTAGAGALQATRLQPRDHTLASVHPRTFTRSAAAGGEEPLRDRGGNLVYIESPGLISAPDVLAFGAAEYTAAQQQSQELLQLLLDELSRRDGRLVLILRVLDMADMKFMKFMQSKQEKDGERLVKEAGKPFADAYPTTTYKNFLINLPAAAGVAAPLVKAVVPARSAKKIVLLGSKFTDELHREADPSMLPRMLGGVLDDGVQWERRKK